MPCIPLGSTTCSSTCPLNLPKHHAQEVLEAQLRVTLDMEAVYQREGDAPLAALHAALEAVDAAAGTAEDAAEGGAAGGGGAEGPAALAAALRGVVWTRSMRRMYTLVDRWVGCDPWR